ncbi:tetratricopeptide repeat protein [Belliella sp. DSM 111904]|uniref:Tetratricopeptide repeat protein n=1 Tax=Belliella filtrata TaxID=2923435 RepID=A0ABS9V095_9BACT|nr:tetratricopeptide repeat protein [Belliella filtrata]MCH7409837.1 tetratricopeptide repeat protein [Belliella filtrata]
MASFEQSVAYFKSGKFDEALDNINECLKEDSDNKEFLFFRARIYSRLGKFDLSLNDFDRLTGFEPFNPTYISDKAVVLHLLGRNEEAASEFDSALNLEPNNPYRYSSRAYFKDRIGDLQGAIDDYTKAIEMDPEDAVAYNNRGLVEEKLGYKELAQRSFQQADDLVGYKPKSENTASSDEHINKQKAKEFTMPKQENPPNSLNVKGYFDVVKKLFTDKSTRDDFFSFIASGFKNK